MTKVLRSIAVAFLVALLFAIHSCKAAGCKSNDAWTGPDKVQHEVGGFFIGAGVTAATDNAWAGVGAAAVAGAAKELLLDRRSATHTCSLQDFVVTVAGGALGAGVAHWGLRMERGRVQVVYARAL